MFTHTPSDKKHIILFVDVNDTMFIGDTAKGVTKEIAICKMLAEQEKYSFVWDAAITTRPMTFKQFVESHLVPGNKRETQVQKAQNEAYSRFIAYLESKQHPLAAEIKDAFNRICENLSNGSIPQSFINLVIKLEAAKTPYTIIFRTFGHDIEDVKQELRRRTHLKYFSQGKIKGGQLTMEGDKVLINPHDILNSIQPFQHAAWNDHFPDWQAAGERYAGGKPFYLDFNDPSKVILFIDDNAKSKQILCVKSVDGEALDQASIQEQLISCGRIVPADTLELCLNNNYFTERLHVACSMPLPLPEQLSRMPRVASL